MTMTSRIAGTETIVGQLKITYQGFLQLLTLLFRIIRINLKEYFIQLKLRIPTQLKFVSRVFYSNCRSKIQSNFSLNVNSHEGSEILRCVTHVKGLNASYRIMMPQVPLQSSGSDINIGGKIISLEWRRLFL